MRDTIDAALEPKLILRHGVSIGRPRAGGLAAAISALYQGPTFAAASPWQESLREQFEPASRIPRDPHRTRDCGAVFGGAGWRAAGWGAAGRSGRPVERHRRRAAA